MLAELHVENFALMEDVRLTFEKGLTVFTGETGAGKSMLIDALSVLLGGRASAEFIRHGAERSRVEGIFEELPVNLVNLLKNEGYYEEEEGKLFLYREINSAGKNVCRVQGRTVPLSLYRAFCEGLVDIHGQMEHQSLLDEKNHRVLLDAFGGVEQLELAENVSKAALNYFAQVKKERELIISEDERKRREDILRYQIDEIDQINPVVGEEEELNQEKQRLGNAERILNLVGSSYENLYGSSSSPGAYDLLGNTRKLLQELVRFDSDCNRFLEQAEAAFYNIEDLSEQIRTYRENFDYEPERLEQIEDRLAKLHKLRKYGSSIKEIINIREEMENELNQISNIEEQIINIKKEKDKALQTYSDLADLLHEKRERQAKRLESELINELADLGLEKSSVEVHMIPSKEPSTIGSEEIKFYFTANVGEPPKSLAKVASGGEISRLMLAFKSLLANAETIGTFIFDEVDSGVGGRMIQKVGEKLAAISQYKQVICITHSAPVAALADNHYAIFKKVEKQRTYTNVKLLIEQGRIEELARMLGGPDIDINLRHAEELLNHVN